MSTPKTKHAAGESDTEEHNIVGAYYSGGPGSPYYQPALECSCGWSVREPTWQDAGASYDHHLASTPERTR